MSFFVEFGICYPFRISLRTLGLYVKESYSWSERLPLGSELSSTFATFMSAGLAIPWPKVSYLWVLIKLIQDNKTGSMKHEILVQIVFQGIHFIICIRNVNKQVALWKKRNCWYENSTGIQLRSDWKSHTRLFCTDPVQILQLRHNVWNKYELRSSNKRILGWNNRHSKKRHHTWIFT